MKLENETLIEKLENILEKGKPKKISSKKTFQNLSGIISTDEANVMKQNIAGVCENIDFNDWK